MKARDLMIGDWVLQDELNIPVKIQGIMCHYADEDVYFYHEAREYISGSNKLQPIPLTPEILEKNGFEKSTIQTTLMIEQQIPPCIRYGIQLGEYSGVYISFGLQDCPIYDIRSDYRVFQGACIYVHELQHALKLCGIDKEIVL